MSDLAPDRLHELYVDQDLTVHDLADRLDVGVGTVVDALHETDWYEPRPDTVLRHTPPEALNDDQTRNLRPDGGTKYTNPTGEGYLGVWRANGAALSIHVGTFQCIDWRSTDDVVAVDDQDGIALVEAADADPDATITSARVRKAGVGTSVSVPAIAVRRIDGFQRNADVRAYEREKGGILLVAADEDPRVPTDGGDPA